MDTATLLPLDKMTVAQKLRVMEEIWADLRKNEDHIPVPEWHKEELERRLAEADAAPESGIPWEQARSASYGTIPDGRPYDDHHS